MLCPACGTDNLVGADICDNCGSELAGGIPQPPTTFQGQLLGARVRDLALSEPHLVDIDSDASDAIGRMQREETDCVLVMDGERLVGVFTDRDAVLKVAGLASGPVAIRDVMTPDPVILRDDDSVAIAIHKMAVGGFRHVPIIRDGRPTGVISAKVIFQHLAERLG